MNNQEYVCVVCGHVHDEELEGAWDTLPDDFTCPECGVGKEDYDIYAFEQCAISSAVERLVYTERVGGSNPSSRTSLLT